MRKNLVIVALCLLMVMPFSCSTWQGMSKTGQGATAGGAAGAAVGTGVGALIGGGKGAWIGALVGSAVGAGTGAVVGNQMDKQQKALEKELSSIRELASQKDTAYIIQTVTDSNNLQAIRVVLGNAILFDTGSSTLSELAKATLSRIAYNFKQYPQTDVTIVGYTDNTGGYDLNMRLSLQRAEAVKNYLVSQGVDVSRLSTVGNGWENPIATNDTKEGRAQNRRVEMFVTANQQMIQNAQ